MKLTDSFKMNSCAGQTTMEYLLITTLLAIVVLMGFKDFKTGSFMEKARSTLWGFREAAEDRISGVQKPPF